MLKDYIRKKIRIYQRLNNLPPWFGRKRQVEIIRRTCLIFLSLFLILSCIFNNQITNFLNNIYFNDKTIISAKSKIHFIDVKQGDCTFVELPMGEKIFIDTGREECYCKISRYLERLNIKKGDVIDFVILTHSDSDHSGGFCKILKDYQVKNVFIPRINSTFDCENGNENVNWKTDDSQSWRKIKEEIYNENCNVYYNFRDYSINGINFYIDFFSPLEEIYDDENDYSPFFILKIFDTKIMFTGDNSTNNERSFLDCYSNQIDQNFFDVDILHVAHHGSKSSTSLDFLSALSPEIAVISCGENNGYGHPTNEVINSLIDEEIQIFRTDTMGSILFAVNENGFESKINFENIPFDKMICEWYMIVFLIIIFLGYIEKKYYDEELVPKILLLYRCRKTDGVFF